MVDDDNNNLVLIISFVLNIDVSILCSGLFGATWYHPSWSQHNSVGADTLKRQTYWNNLWYSIFLDRMLNKNIQLGCFAVLLIFLTFQTGMFDPKSCFLHQLIHISSDKYMYYRRLFMFHDCRLNPGENNKVKSKKYTSIMY